MIMVQSIKEIAPSLKIVGDSVTMKVTDFRKLLEPITSPIEVNERWYLNQYSDVAAAVKRGEISSATAHFRFHGFLEGRLPRAPVFDEVWYLKTNPDVAQAVKAGKIKSAMDHYIYTGVYEGRLPGPQARKQSHSG